MNRAILAIGVGLAAVSLWAASVWADDAALPAADPAATTAAATTAATATVAAPASAAAAPAPPASTAPAAPLVSQPPAPADGLPSVDSVIAMMGDKMKGTRDVAAEVRVTRLDLAAYVGSYRALPPDYARLDGEMKETGPVGAETVVGTLRMVRARGIVHVENLGRGTAQETIGRIDLAEMTRLQKELGNRGPSLQELVPPDFGSCVSEMKARGYELKVIKADRDLVTLEARKDPGDAVRGWQKVNELQVITISAADGFPRSIKVFSDGRLEMDLEFSKVRTNVGLTPADFNYQPPSGREVLDMVTVLRQAVAPLNPPKVPDK